jgi:hypothetical protein
LIGKFIDHENGSEMFSDTSVDFKGLYGVISQKREVFISLIVRTSNSS